MDGNKKHYVWGGPKEWSFGGASDFDVPFYTFSNFFEDNQVEKVIKLCESFPLVDGTMSNEANTDKGWRSSDIRWLENNHKTKWIYDSIWTATCNTNGWNYTITGFVDLCQYTTYDSSKYKKPSKNCPVGVIKKIIPEGPSPDNSTPLIYINKGITVIGPAKNSQNIILGFEIVKSFKLFLKIKNKITKAIGKKNMLSINKPTSASTLIFFLNKL